MKVKGEDRKNKLVECAMCRCVSVRAHVRVREVVVSLSGDFLEKGGKKNAKQERFRKKVHLFFGVIMWFREISTFSCCKFRLFEIKDIPLLSIKHNLPFSRRSAASL